MSQVFGLKSLLPLWEKGFRDEGKKICQSTRYCVLTAFKMAEITIGLTIQPLAMNFPQSTRF
jgi:hypothetical protein